MRRRDETDIRGVLLCPQTLFFQAFLITLRGREQCGTQTPRTPSESSTVGSFSVQKKAGNQRGESRVGCRERYGHQRRLGTSSAGALLFAHPLVHLHKLDAKRVWTRPDLEAALDYLLAL